MDDILHTTETVDVTDHEPLFALGRVVVTPGALDLGCNFTRKRSEHYIRTWSVGVFNAYGRPNIMFVTLNKDETDGLFKLQRLSVLQFIPYITYKLQF